jgi:hypothetical protein
MIATTVLPITTRPAGPISAPDEIRAPAAYWIRDEERTWAPTSYKLDGDQLVWGPLWRYKAFPIPSRVYLHELRRIDLHDGEQLLEFSNQFGALGVCHDPGTSMPLDEIREPAALIRTLTSVYHLHENGLFTDEGIAEWKWDTDWLAPPTDPYEGHEFFTNEMNRLLGPVTPTVGFGNHQQRPSTLLDALVIQLFNDVAAGVTYKSCANENCGELFVDQINSKGKRHSRKTGTLYCSPRCAKAQAQRNYRRRNGHRT